MKENGYILLFDDICSLCNRMVTFIIKRDNRAKIKFASITSVTGRAFLKKIGKNSNDTGSVVLIDGDIHYHGSRAILNLFRIIGGAWKLFYILIIIPPAISDFFYKYLSKNRFRFFGRTKFCVLHDSRWTDRFLE